jgi:hypothetical protein
MSLYSRIEREAMKVENPIVQEKKSVRKTEKLIGRNPWHVVIGLSPAWQRGLPPP